MVQRACPHPRSLVAARGLSDSWASLGPLGAFSDSPSGPRPSAYSLHPGGGRWQRGVSPAYNCAQLLCEVKGSALTVWGLLMLPLAPTTGWPA